MQVAALLPAVVATEVGPRAFPYVLGLPVDIVLTRQPPPHVRLSLSALSVNSSTRDRSAQGERDFVTPRPKAITAWRTRRSTRSS